MSGFKKYATGAIIGMILLKVYQNEKVQSTAKKIFGKVSNSIKEKFDTWIGSESKSDS